MPRRKKDKEPEDSNKKILLVIKNPKSVSASMETAATISFAGTLKRKRSANPRRNRGQGGGKPDDHAEELSEDEPPVKKGRKKQSTGGGTGSSIGVESPQKRVRRGKGQKSLEESEDESEDESDEEKPPAPPAIKMTHDEAMRVLEETGKKLAQETISDAIEKLNAKPKNATTVGLVRMFVIPLDVCFPGHTAVIQGKTYHLNPRNITEEGIETASGHFRKHGYEYTMGSMLRTVAVNGKSEPLEPGFREKMNPVARAKYDKWEKKKILTRAESDKETPQKKEALFLKRYVLGNKVFVDDGQHR
jgi:hypothetical protein